MKIEQSLLGGHHLEAHHLRKKELFPPIVVSGPLNLRDSRQWQLTWDRAADQLTDPNDAFC